VVTIAQFDQDNRRIARPSEVLGNIKVWSCKSVFIHYLERFSTGRRNTETEQPLWPVTNYADNPVYQSKLEANTCSRREGRENVRERVMTCSFLTSDWFRKWREFLFLYTNH